MIINKDDEKTQVTLMSIEMILRAQRNLAVYGCNEVDLELFANEAAHEFDTHYPNDEELHEELYNEAIGILVCLYNVDHYNDVCANCSPWCADVWHDTTTMQEWQELTEAYCYNPFTGEHYELTA